MPQIPLYDGPQVQTRALRPVFQRAPDVSSGTQALARAVGQLGDIADQRVRRDAEVEANRIDADITGGWLAWDSAARRDPKYRGEGVAQYEADAAKWWEDAKKTYGTDANGLVREQIGVALARKRNQAMGSVMGYATQERERFADDQSEAAAKSSIEFAIDTGDTAGAAARVRQIAAEKGARKGWTTEMVQADQQRLLGTLHLSYIETVAERDATAARAYYEANKGEIPGQVQARVEKVLKGEADNQFALQFAARNATLPLSEQLAKAGEIADPERREKALTQIRNNQAMVKAAQQEREQAAADQAWQLVGQNRTVPESVLVKMDGRSRVQLQDYVKQRAQQAATGEAVKTDWATYIDLRERLAAGERINLTPYTTRLAGPQIEQLLDLQGKGGSPAKVDSMMTDQQRIDQALVGLGIDKKKDPETAGLFQSEVDRRVRAASQEKGKDLTATEKQSIVDRVALDKVYVDEFGTDPQKPVAMLTPEELANAYVRVNGKEVKVSSVPARDRQQIIAALRATGQVPTEQAIVEMYLRSKNPQRASGAVIR